MCTCECLVSRHFDIPADILNGFKDKKVRALASVQVQYKLKEPKNQSASALKRVTSLFAHLEKFSINFSSSTFAIRVNLLHHYFFQVSFNFNVIL